MTLADVVLGFAIMGIAILGTALTFYAIGLAILRIVGVR